MNDFTHCAARTLALVLLALLPAGVAVAGDRTDRGERSGPPELQHELIELDHISPHVAEQALMPFASRWGRIEANRELGTLTLVDEPALVRKMIEVLGRIDVPRPSWNFRILLVLAENRGVGSPELGPLIDHPSVAQEIQELFRFDTFEELDTALITVRDGSQGKVRVGGEHDYTVSILPEARGADALELEFHLYRASTLVDGADATVLHGTIVETSFQTAPGEITIVGASRLNGGDKALITIVETRLPQD